MEKVITAAVNEFKVKLTDTIYDRMVEECFIDAGDTERDRIADLIASAKYHADSRRLILRTNDYLMSNITKILEHIAVDFHRYIDNIWFSAKPTNHIIIFDIQIDLELCIPNIVEIFYFEKAKAKIDQ